MRLWCAWPVFLMSWLAACGRTPLPTSVKGIKPPGFDAIAAEVLSKARASSQPAGGDVVVGLTPEPARLFAWDPEAGVRWEQPVAPRSGPRLVGDVVVLDEAQGVTVRALQSGETLLVLDEEERLVGAAASADLLVLTLSPPEHASARGAVVAARGGQVLWERALALPVGQPAVAGGHVLLPWATQRLSILSGKTGEELARAERKDMVLGHALVQPAGIFVGQHGLLAFTPKFEAASKRRSGYFEPVRRELPAQPAMLGDGYAAAPAPDNAMHRVRLEWLLAGDGSAPQLQDGVMFLRFYRLVFALAAEADAVRWAWQSPADVVGAWARPGGLWVLDAQGALSWLDVNGRRVPQATLDRAVQVAAVRMAPPANVEAEAEGGRKGDLQAQLLDAARLDDARLALGRAFAARQLAQLPGAEVTAHLVSLCAERDAPEPVVQSACEGLAGRKEGPRPVLAALRRFHSFANDVPAPPAGALGRAAAGMGIRSAAPLLRAHLERADTPAAELEGVVEALVHLEHRAALPVLERLVRVHRAEPRASALTPGLEAAVSAIVALGGDRGRSFVERFAEDAWTAVHLREAAERALHPAAAAAAAQPAPGS